MRNIEKEKKDKIVKNVKRVSVGAGISSAAIISGVMISESNKTISHEQDNSNSVITNGNFALNTNATIVTQNPTWTAEYNAIKNLLNTVSTSALTTAGIISPSDVTQTTLDALVGTTSQNLMAKLVRVATTATGNTAPTADATSAFIRYQIVEKNNQSNIWSNSDSTFSNDLRASTFSKSNNQKTLDAANPTVTPSTTITNSFFTSASATLKTNYTLSNAAGATIDTVVLTSSPTAAQVTGDSVPYTANANVNLKLGTATRVVPITLTYNKVNKQPAIDLVSSNINSLTLSGDKWSSKISSTNIDFGTNVAAISSFAKVQYQIDGGSWTDLFTTPSNATSVQSSISSGIALPNGALLGASNVSFRITETTSKPASHIYNLPTTRVVSTSALTQVIDIKDILSEIASGDTFKITGNSKGAVLTAKTYPNINLEVKVNGSSTWQTIAQANTALAALNLWNNNSNAFQTLNFDYRITSTNGAALYDSSATATASIVGTTGKSDSKPFDSTALSGLIKLIETTAISGAVSGNTKAITLPTISAPNNTEIEFEVFNGATSLVKGTKTQVESWIAANNLWNSTTNAWRATSIKARIKLTNATGFALSSNQEVELWNSTSNSLSKLVETQAQTISISGASNAMTISQPANTPATTGFDFEYELVGVSGFTGWKTKSEIETWISTNNLWDQNSGTNGAWKATAINARLKPASGFILDNQRQAQIWTSATATNLKFVDTTSITTLINSLRVTGDDKHLVWDVAAVVALATKSNLKVEYVYTNSATTPSSGFADISTISNQWNTTGTLGINKHIWIKVSPKDANFTTTSASQVSFDIASTSGIQSLLTYYEIQPTDLNGVVLLAGSNSKNLNFATPTKNEFDYEFSIDGGNVWTTLAAMNVAISNISTEGIWNSTTQSWRISDIQVRPASKTGYKLSNQSPKVIWSSTTPGAVAKWIDTTSIPAQITSSVIVGVDSTNTNVNWSAAQGTLLDIQNKGVKIEFLLSTISLADKGLSSAAWTTTLPTNINEDVSKRFIYARISPLTSGDSITTNVSQNYIDITNSSNIKTALTEINTDSINIDGGVVSGDSHSLSGTTVFSVASAAGLTQYQKNGLQLVFTLSNWQIDPQLASKLGITGTIPAQMTETDLKSYFNGTTANLWDHTANNWATHLQAKLIAKPGYALTSDREVRFDFDSLGLQKFINTQSLITQLTSGANPVKVVSTSTNDHVTWQQPTLISMGYNQPIASLQFLVGNYSSISEVNAAPLNAWTTSLPSTIDFNHSSRHIWVKFDTAQNFILSNDGPIDLTTTSAIQTIKSKVDSLPEYTNINLSKIEFTGTTDNALINEVLAGTIPTGAQIMYQVQFGPIPANGNQPVWTTSAWMTATAFAAYLKTTPNIHIRTIKTHLQTIDATKFTVVNDKITTINIDNFFSYKNISTELSAMTTTGIKVLGVLGQPNAIEVIIPSALRESTLNPKQLVLQFSINGGPFENFVAKTTEQQADNSLGFEQALAGSYDIMTIPDSANPSLQFRVIPWANDEGTTTSVKNENDWLAIVEDVKVKTSDIVSAGNPSVLMWNVANLPKLVQTRVNALSALSVSGSTKELVISGLDSTQINQDLNNINTQPGYSSYVEVGFQLSDGNISSNLFFRRSDFITWLSGSATSAMKVFNATTNKMETLPANALKPNWNRIDLDSVKSRWISIDEGYRVSDPSTHALSTHSGAVYNVKKWTDLTTYTNLLKTLVLSGDTAHINKTALQTIVDRLRNDFGADAFDIFTTTSFNGTNPDFSSAMANVQVNPNSANDLNIEMNFLYEIGFKIMPHSTRGDLIASTLATPTTLNPIVVWDKNSSASINKFIHILSSSLSTVVLSGDSRNWSYISPAELLKTDVNGIMSATGVYSGVEIWARVAGTTFSAWRTIEQLKTDMASANINVFDGSWGRDKIELQYRVKTGYAASTAELQNIVKPSVDALNRFIDITSLLTQAQAGVVIKSKNTSEGWWNESSSAYDDHKSWTGYVDNKDFDLEDITVASRLHVEIEYSLDNSTWTKTKPTQLNDVAANRNLYIRYVATTDYLPGEAPILSDLTSKNITTSSGVRNVLTNVNISSTDLSKIQFEGDTRRMTESLTSAAIQAHTHVEYSITNFMAKDKASAIAELAKIGIVNSGATASIFNAYNASMTWSELQAFIVSISPIDTIKEILRNSIAARVVADTGYSITQPDDAAKRLKIDVSKLYTLKDITPAVNLLQLASKAGDQDGINLYGIKATNPFEADGVTPTKEGILVQIPDALYDFMQAHGLKIQFTKDGITSGASTTIAPTASWSDAPLSSFVAAAVPGSPTVSHGFLTRLDAINGKYSFIGFRLVPTVNDENTASTAQANDALTAHYDATMTKLFTSTGAFPNKQYTLQAPFYSIDTSKIPTVIRVDKIDLTQISVTGDTRFADILRGSDMHSQIDAENGDQSLDDNLQLVYSIDLKDGTYIDTDKSNPNALWLTELDMEAYLKGDLIVSGGKVINKNNPSQIVEAFDASVISARGLKNGDAVTPKYLDINTKLYVKWSSMTSDYVANSDFIPSKIEPFAVSTTASTYRKWFDGNAFNNLITQLEISGTTQSATSYTIDYSKATALQPTELDKHNLKMQYSFDGQVWQDNKLDFSTQSWAIQTARQIYMRVVPKTYTGTTTITNFVEVDGIKVDYQFAQNKKAEALANTSTVTGAVRNFLVYLDIDKTQLSALSISGNSFELDSAALNESSIDTEVDKYSAVEIQYLFNGVWYNKAALLAEMQRIRTSITNADKAAALVMPTDFIHTTVQARWHVLDVNNFVIKDKTISTGTVNANQQVSAGEEITKTNFKTFINAWAIQDKTTNNFRASIGVQNALFSLSAAQDTTSNQFKLSANMIDITKFNFDILNSLGLKAQFLTQEANPSLELSNAKWIDFAWTKTGDTLIINNAEWTTGSATPLWFRIVPIDSTTAVSSTTTSNGLASTVTPMQIDTTKVKTQISTQSDILRNLVISGDTQSLLNANENPFTIPVLNNGKWEIPGIIGDPNKTGSEKELTDWLADAGLRLNYKVTATRTKGVYIAGQDYQFNSLAELKAALQTTNLNFDRSTLQVRWDFSNNINFAASDAKWVNPVVTTVQNVVYTEDIFSLTATALKVSGNNLKLQAPAAQPEVDRFIQTQFANVVLSQAELQKLGLKLQYNWTAAGGNPDVSKWSDVAPDGSANSSLNGNKDYWIRYAPINNDYKLASNRWTSDPSQITALNVEEIKLAIPFTAQTILAVKDELKNIAIEGTTYQFNWQAGKTLPSVNLSADSLSHGHIQYSRDNIRWADTIQGALSDTDHYSTGMLSLDKDRGDKLYVRYVYEETSGNVNPIDSSKWVFTDAVGNEIPLADLKQTVDIDNLIQPIMTSQTLTELTGQPSISINGLTNPIGGVDFGAITWQQLANYGLFKPNFVAGNNDQVADFRSMWYDGKLRDANGNYIFGMGINPFNSSDVETKTDLTALLPRHTHLEYRWSGSATGTTSSWTSVAPTGVIKNSNYDGFEVRLVADGGYMLSESNGAGISFSGTFADGSTANAITLPSQEWTKRYSVVVELLTRDVHLPSISSEQAQFIGWNAGPNGLSATGTFFTDGAGGDHSPSNDANALKNIMVKLLNGNNDALDFLKDDRGYVLEWNVKNAGRNIDWTDSRGFSGVDWHPSVAGNMNMAPNSTVPWYGAYPTGLKNGDEVEVRLRARDGYVISNDDLSSDYNNSTKTSRWSHVMKFDVISTLTNRIIIPSDFAIYDPRHLFDIKGQPFVVNGLMPLMTFDGNEGSGQLRIQGGQVNPHYHFEAAVLRPLVGTSLDAVTTDEYQAPQFGYVLESIAQQKAERLKNPNWKPTIIYSKSSGYVNNWKDLVSNAGAWQNPNDIKDLNVGDVVVTRLVADAGWGFAWEDTKSAFKDIEYPKQYSIDAFGTQNSIAAEFKFDNGNDRPSINGIPDISTSVIPVPVRGLTVLPRFELSSLALVYDTDPQYKLDNGQARIWINHYPGQKININGVETSTLDDKYRWEYTITYTNGTSQTGKLTQLGQLPTGLRNGDIISLRAVPLNSSFVLDQNYVNNPITLTVSGLSQPIDATGIARPILTISGYDGEGTISAITPKVQPSYWNTNPDPQFPLGRPELSHTNPGEELVWEYQVVSGEDPRALSDERLNALDSNGNPIYPWTENIPNNLKYGDYVRMRVGTVDKTKVALEGGTKWIYSEDSSYVAPATGYQNPAAASWFFVKNLNLNVNNFDYTISIDGFRQQTTLSYDSLIDSLDADHIERQYHVIYKDPAKGTSAWVNGSDPILKKLDNGDIVEMRVVASSGYVFDINDDNPSVGIHVYTEQNNGKTLYVLQKTTWKTEVKDLLKLLNVNGVSSLFNEGFIQNMNGRPLFNGMTLDGNAEVRANPSTVDFIDYLFTGQQTIVDVDGHPTDPITSKPYSQLVGARFIVKQVDPFTGQQLPETILPEGTFPSSLSNGDVVTVELYSKDQSFKLSRAISASITIKGLITVVDEDITDPILTFSGESGKGSVTISPLAPKRTKWVYAVTHELLPGESLQQISEDVQVHPVDPDATWISAHPGVYYWTSTPPTDLVNGDYVISMLVSSIPGAGGLKVNNTSRPGQTPMNMDWIRVQGLAQRIDLSKYQFNLIDVANAWTPNIDNGYREDDPSTPAHDPKPISLINYAFKLEGHQEGQAGIAIASPLEALDISTILVDKTGKPLPTSIASVVQWAFAVNDDPSPTGNYNWSTSLPKALFNGQYVHAKLVAKVGTTNIDVYGYRPQVFKVDGLDAQASISNKVVTLVAAILGGIGGLGAAVGTLLFLRKRKKKLHFSDKF